MLKKISDTFKIISPCYLCLFIYGSSIYSNEALPGSKIFGYELSEGCGFYGPGIQKETAAFKIFAEGNKFDSIGNLNVNNFLQSGENLAESIQDYVISIMH